MSTFPLCENAERVCQKRIYLKDLDGKVVEDWTGLCQRLASTMAKPEISYDLWYERFFNAIFNLDFLPNSPCMVNAGRGMCLSACFVLPIEDSMEGIFNALKYAALVHKEGGGTGFSFSNLRGSGSRVSTTKGTASGPISFLKVFNAATESIKQGGVRRGANMAVLRVDHPDFREFIHCKNVEGEIANFNISLHLTDAFMTAVLNEADHMYDIVDPHSKQVVRRENALEVFNEICEAAWTNGEPGALFLDTTNKFNVTPHIGQFEAVNPCGEQNLLPYEACNLSSINLNNFITFDKTIDYDRLAVIVQTVTRFMDNVVSINNFPVEEINKATQLTRKLGIGIMGLGDIFIKLGIDYDSEAARELAREIYTFIYKVAVATSEELAKEKGAFPGYDPVLCDYPPRRNAALTAIAPTGTLSMIADCSSGCEPLFGITFVKEVIDGTKFRYANAEFELVARREGFWTPALIDKIEANRGCKGIDEIPLKYQTLFATANEISVEGHVRMQAVLQNNGCDTGISKTINMPNYATVEDVKEMYLSAWKLGCKGITMYRAESRKFEVLSHTVTHREKESTIVTDYIPASKRKLPEEMTAKRYTLLDGKDNKQYIVVVFDEQERPMEIFTKFSGEGRPENIERFTYWNTICRQVSLSLRHGVAMAEIVRQLDKSTVNMFDLPAQLSRILKLYMSKSSTGYQAGSCPECGEALGFEEGCEKCVSCGFSKCA